MVPTVILLYIQPLLSLYAKYVGHIASHTRTHRLRHPLTTSMKVLIWVSFGHTVKSTLSINIFLSLPLLFFFSGALSGTDGGPCRGYRL